MTRVEFVIKKYGYLTVKNISTRYCPGDFNIGPSVDKATRSTIGCRHISCWQCWEEIISEEGTKK